MLLDHVLGLLRDALGVAGGVGVVDRSGRRRRSGLSFDRAHQSSSIARSTTSTASERRGRVGALGRARLCGVVADRQRGQPDAAAEAAASCSADERLAEDDEPPDEQRRKGKGRPEVPARGGLLGDAGAERRRRGRGWGPRAEVGVFLVAVFLLFVGGGGVERRKVEVEVEKKKGSVSCVERLFSISLSLYLSLFLFFIASTHPASAAFISEPCEWE